MKENIQSLIDWWKFVKPNKKYFFLSFLCQTLYRIGVIIEPIFAARIITSLTAGEYMWAVYNLIFGVIVYISYQLAHHFKYMVHPYLLGDSYLKFVKMVSDKIIMADKDNFKYNSKEKLLNIVHSDVNEAVNFADTLTTKLGNLVQVAITFVIVISTCWQVSLLILMFIFINSYILSLLQTKYAEKTKYMRESVDSCYASFSKLLDGCNSNITDAQKAKLQSSFIKANESYIHNFKQRQYWGSGIDKWYYSLCKILIASTTAIMIYLVYKQSLSLEMYLIIVPYITSIIDMSNDFLSGFTTLKTSLVSMNRVKVISNFTERDIVKFGNNARDNILGSIDFIDFSYQMPGSRLNDINFHIQHNESSLIYSKNRKTLNLIYDLLKREKDYPDKTKSQIYIDGLSIKRYSKTSYYNNLTFIDAELTSHNYTTIYRTLKESKQKRKRILQACKEVGVFEFVKYKNKGLNTSMSELSDKERFIVELTKALLSKANIIVIQDMPRNLEAKEYIKLLKLISDKNNNKTILLFSSYIENSYMADKIVEISNGKISNIQFNDRTATED